MTKQFNPVFADRPKSIFPTMSGLARAHNAINLGQGFPDEDGPSEVLQAAAHALLEGPNQYVPVEGVAELREAIARANKRFYGLDIDPQTETLVLAGATEGLAAAFLAYCSPGDEVVIFAPFYEAYAPQAEAAGAVTRYVSLQPPSWRIDPDALEQAISAKTKMIVINTPHNPTGHVMDRAELEIVADAARRHDLVVLCDEVYEHLIFDGRPHVPLMSLPDMKERCVRIGSAGKTFSLTGWRIGYATGPARLIEILMKAHQFIAYTCPSHLQYAVAKGLDLGSDYYEAFTSGMQVKRDLLQTGLTDIGFEVLDCEGTYFVSVDIGSMGADDDVAFCRDLTMKAGVAAVPVSAFYHPAQPDIARRYARFCFCKKIDVLEEALVRLRSHFS